MYWAILTPVVRKIILIALAVTVLVGGGWYLHHSGYKSGYAVAEAIGQNKLNEYKEAQQKQLDALYEKQRMVEHDLQTKLLQSLKEKEDEIKAINDTHDRLIRGLRDRASRRDSTPVTIETTTTTPFECTRAVSTGQELSREDGEFLVGEAASADILRKALRLCRESYQRLLAPIENK